MAIKMSELRAKYPDLSDLSDDQLLHGLHKTMFPDMPAGAFYREIDYDTQREKLQQETAQQGSWGERALQNFGAGVDTIVQGTKQLVGKGPTDAEIDEKRKRDAQLASGTTGGGALQFAGEVLPTMAAGAVAGAGLGAAGAGAAASPILAQTLARAPQLQRLAQAPGWLRTMVGGGLGGAASSTLEPVKSTESRAEKAAIAGTVGMAVPPVVSAAASPLAAAGEHLGNRLLGRTAAAKKAAEFAREHMPEGYDPSAIYRAGNTVDIPYGHATYNIPVSAAQATFDPYLTQLEALSRQRPATGPMWQRFQEGQNANIHHATQDMAPTQLEQRVLENWRETGSTPMRNRALATARSGNFADPVLAHVQRMLEGASGGNPAVVTLGSYVEQALGAGGHGMHGPTFRGPITPERLYEVRKVLAAKLNGPAAMGDEISAAARNARRETQGMIDAIDDALDNASRQRWSPYLQEHRARSAEVNTGEALQGVAEEFSPLRKATIGGVPQVTAAGYGKALEKAAENKFGSKLKPEAQRATEQLHGVLRMIEDQGRSRKLAGTMGGGSQTAMDTALNQAGDSLLQAVLKRIPLVGKTAAGAVEATARMNQERMERELAQMLMEPTRLAAALRQLPPEWRMRLFDSVGRSANASTGAAAGAANAQ